MSTINVFTETSDRLIESMSNTISKTQEINTQDKDWAITSKLINKRKKFILSIFITSNSMVNSYPKFTIVGLSGERHFAPYSFHRFKGTKSKMSEMFLEFDEIFSLLKTDKTRIGWRKRSLFYKIIIPKDDLTSIEDILNSLSRLVVQINKVK